MHFPHWVYGRRYTFTWEQGRQLKKAVVGGKTTNYKYNAEGIRTEKTVSGEYTDTYRLNGTQIVEMMRESGSPTVRLVFIYDENGRPYSLELYNYSYNLIDKYYYITNVQGDVIRLIDDNNEVVANYTYDAWGKLISITDAGGNAITASNHIAIRNPIRYRGYFYDEDTKLYYCNSRYYDPQTRRFINADGYVSTGTGFNGYNMFAYCNNNPVMYFDSAGESSSSGLSRFAHNIKKGFAGIQNFYRKSKMYLNYKFNKEPREIAKFEKVIDATGSLSLHDNNRFGEQNIYHEQLGVISYDSPEFNPKSGSIGLGSVSGDIYAGGWEYENVDLSLLDLGHAEAAFMVENGSFNVGAMASVYSPSCSFNFFGWTFEVGAEVLSAGIGAKKDADSFSFSIGAGIGGSFKIKWD